MKLAPEVLLKETYQYIVDHPEEHDQGSWYGKNTQRDALGRFCGCGTAYCFAGMAIHLAYPQAEFMWSDSVYPTKNKGEGPKYIPTLAADLLGLDEDQVRDLFRASNSLDRIREILEEWQVL